RRACSRTSNVDCQIHPNVVRRSTFDVNRGKPIKSTRTFPSQITTAENKYPCWVISDWRMLKIYQVRVTWNAYAAPTRIWNQTKCCFHPQSQWPSAEVAITITA